MKSLDEKILKVNHKLAKVIFEDYKLDKITSNEATIIDRNPAPY